MKLFLIIERSYACTYNGGATDIELLRGIYRHKENAEKVLKKKFMSEGYVHNAKMIEIETDLFEDKEL